MKIFTILTLLFILISLNACHRETKDFKLIGKKEMALLLADIHIAEASASNDIPRGDSLDQVIINYYYYLLEKHKISKTDFIGSWHYYQQHPEKLKPVYDEVTEILSIKRGEKWD